MTKCETARILDNYLLSLQYNEYEVIMVAWPRPRAWEKTKRDTSWHSIRPTISIPKGDIEEHIRLLCVRSQNLLAWLDTNYGQMLLPLEGPLMMDSRSETEMAWLKFYQFIPEAVRSLIGRCYHQQHWEMLSFVAQGGDHASELIASNPALSYALVTIDSDYRISDGSFLIKDLDRMFKPGTSQLDMLEWLGFPPTKAVRRILKKLTPDAITYRNLCQLRNDLCSDEIRKTLSHLGSINGQIVGIVTDPELFSLTTPKLLDEVGSLPEDLVDDAYPATDYFLSDVLELHRMLPQGMRRLPRFHSRKHIRDVWLMIQDDLLKTDFKDKMNLCRKFSYPPPPYPGNGIINPISSFSLLEKEAREQRNCVITYSVRIIMEREVYLYSVLWPERCTLSLEKDNDRWVLKELARAENLPASENTYDEVRKWLQHHHAKQEQIRHEDSIVQKEISI